MTKCDGALMKLFSMIFSFVILQSAVALSGEATLQDIVARNVGATVFLEVREESPNGEVRPLRTGSGVLINQDGHILTAKHVIEAGSKERIPAIRGAIGSHSEALRKIEVILHSNSGQDFALLKFLAASNTEFSKVSVSRDLLVPSGGTVFALGFPYKRDIHPLQGNVSNHNGPRGAWQTSLHAHPGMSGGPVFDDSGSLVGLVAGGDPSSPGLDFVLPVRYALDLLLSAGAVQLADLTPTLLQGGMTQVVGTPQIVGPAVTRVFDVKLVNDVHTKLFEEHTAKISQTISAPTGFEFKFVKFNPTSKARAGKETISLSEDKTNVTISAPLTSGPIVDRYRGWLKGELAVELVSR